MSWEHHTRTLHRPGLELRISPLLSDTYIFWQSKHFPLQMSLYHTLIDVISPLSLLIGQNLAGMSIFLPLFTCADLLLYLLVHLMESLQQLSGTSSVRLPTRLVFPLHWCIKQSLNSVLTFAMAWTTQHSGHNPGRYVLSPGCHYTGSFYSEIYTELVIWQQSSKFYSSSLLPSIYWYS